MGNRNPKRSGYILLKPLIMDRAKRKKREYDNSQGSIVFVAWQKQDTYVDEKWHLICHIAIMGRNWK